jgi:hypothetical protein
MLVICYFEVRYDAYNNDHGQDETGFAQNLEDDSMASGDQSQEPSVERDDPS